MRTCGEGLLEALTASQVHHEELAYFDTLQGPLLLPWGCSVPLDDGQHDYGMTATGMGIQPCECKHPASPVHTAGSAFLGMLTRLLTCTLAM